MKKLLPICIIFSISFFLFISCSDNSTGSGERSESTQTYQVSVSMSPSEGGSVSPSEGTYEEGEEVSLQATANDGYLFAGWTGDLQSTENPLSFSVDENYNLTANFDLKTYPLTINTEGEGVVSENVVEQKATDYDHGTVVELTANPAEGYKFVKWQGAVTGKENPVQITVNAPKEVTAVFEKKSYPLTVNANGEGAVSEQVVQQKTTDYKFGTVVELTANPAKGWKFTEWQGAAAGSTNPMQITIEDSTEITAVFEKKSFAVNIAVTGEGTITKNPHQADYLYESTVNLEANPAIGWRFVKWEGDISSTDNPLSIVIDTTMEITAVFESSFAGGTGTEADPFQISTIEQFQKINSSQAFKAAHYIQINDIDASATAGGTNGIDFTPISAFAGAYNGQEYAITDLRVYITGFSDSGGLFDSIEQGAKVSNVKLVNVDVTGGWATGSLVGTNFGHVANSSAMGMVQCKSVKCGGLVGENYGKIDNSYADVDVTSSFDNVGGLVGSNRQEINNSFALGDVSGDMDVGGLVGSNSGVQNSNYENRIYRSYARGNVTGTDNVGGLVGINFDNSFISYCYATGKVTLTSSDNSYVGGLVGLYNFSSKTLVEHCYWDKDSTGQTEAVRGGDSNLTGLTTNQMSGNNAEANMPDFDFENIWVTVDGDYPALFWE